MNSNVDTLSQGIGRERDDAGLDTVATAGGPSKGWRRRLFFPLLALAIGSFCSFAIAEVVLRLFVDQEAKRLATYDQNIGWRGRPNGSGVYVRKVDNIRIPFHYNNIGFRDEDVTPKPAGGRRLLLLGDSFIENLEVDYPQTFPALLEQQIKQRSANWDTIVVGSQGYSTAQQLLAFRRYRELISPDVVLLCFYCGNDFEDNLRRRFAYLDEDEELQIPQNQDPKWKHQARWLQRWLYESSHVVFLAKNGIQSIANINIAPASKSAVAADQQYKQKITARLLRKLDEEVRGSGATLGVVVIPFRDDLAAGNRECQDFVMKLCSDNGIACLDLSSLLRNNHFFKTDIHFNPQGHQIVAEAIDDFVIKSFGLE